MFKTNKVVKDKPIKYVNWQKNLTFEEDKLVQEIEDVYINKANQTEQSNNNPFGHQKSTKKFEKKIKNLKLKRIQNEESCYLKIVEMNHFEKLNVYNDSYPFLRQRKFLYIIYLYL